MAATQIDISHSFCIMKDIHKFHTIQKGTAYAKTYRQIFRTGQGHYFRI